MKRKRSIALSVFVFLLCLAGGIYGRTVQAADNVITDFSRIFYIPAGAAIRGGDLQELHDIYDSMGCTAYTEDGGDIYLDVIWDYSGIDRQTVGAYEITGTVQLPDGYTSKVNLPVWKASVSVQNPGQPEIHVYSRMIAAGIYYFPWIVEQDPDTMTIWMKKEGEDWVNVSEEGYGLCDTDGMYLSCQSMVPDSIYTLAVTYNGGKTRNLTYRYERDGTLDLISYQPGLLGSLIEKETVIRSCEPVNEKSLKRCMAYAVKTGQSLAEVQQDLEDTFHILGSTCEEFEDSASHPAVVMPSVWDFGQVNTSVPGVYQVTGQFAAPDGFTLAEDMAVPEAVAYITVQNPDQPQLQTCYMAASDILFFPMVLESFAESRLGEFQVYLKENGNETKVREEAYYFTPKGLYLKKELLQMNREYGIYVQYPGGCTGEYTFCMDEDLITNEHWYERNYADRDGKDLPDIDNGPEKVTDVSTIMVGNRLADLISTGASQIPFEKDGVQVKVPADVAEDWEVGEDDVLQVDISREDGEISVKISKNGEEITDIPGATVEYPYSSGGGQGAVLTDEDGNEYTGTVDETQNVAVVPIDKTGEYLIEEKTEEDSSEESQADAGEDESLDDEEFLTKGVSQPDQEVTAEKELDDDLAFQRKKTAVIIGIIVILLILLWYLPMRRGRKLRKGDRGEEGQGR